MKTPEGTRCPICFSIRTYPTSDGKDEFIHCIDCLEETKVKPQAMTIIEMIKARIKQLEHQLGQPEILDQARIEAKLDAYKEILSEWKQTEQHPVTPSIISQIEGLKYENGNAYSRGINNAIDDILEILRQSSPAVEAEKTVIKANALRKKGTDKWYFYDANMHQWLISAGWTTIYFGNIELYNITNHPTDAELIDIEITYQPKQEGGKL